MKGNPANQIVRALLDEDYVPDEREHRAGSPQDPWRQGGLKKFRASFTGKRPKGELGKPASKAPKVSKLADRIAWKPGKKPSLGAPGDRFKWKPPTNEAIVPATGSSGMTPPGAASPDALGVPDPDTEETSTPVTSRPSAGAAATTPSPAV